jgi:hypothetical protein
VRVMIEVDIEPRDDDSRPLASSTAEYMLHRIIEFGVRDALPARMAFVGYTVKVASVRTVEARVTPPNARCDHGCRPMTCPVMNCPEYVMNFPL